MGVGIQEQQVERVALGDGSEPGAVGGTDQRIQLLPGRRLGALAVELLNEFSGLGTTEVVLKDFSLGLGQLILRLLQMDASLREVGEDGGFRVFGGAAAEVLVAGGGAGDAFAVGAAHSLGEGGEVGTFLGEPSFAAGKDPLHVGAAQVEAGPHSEGGKPVIVGRR